MNAQTSISGLVMFIAMFVGQLLLFGLPPVFWAIIGKQPFGQAFHLRRRPRWDEMTGATLIALGMVPAATLLFVAQNQIVPLDVEKLKEQYQLFAPMMQDWWFLAVPLIPIAAAVTEEMLFRGVLQNALLKRLPALVALVVTAVLFAGLHLDLQGMVIRTLLGLLFGWMVYRGKSLYPALWAHFLYDAVLLGSQAWDIRTRGAQASLAELAKPNLGQTASNLLIAVAWGGACLTVGAYLSHRAHQRVQAEIAAMKNPAAWETGAPTGVADAPLPAG